MTLGRYQLKQKRRLGGPTGICEGETDAATSETPGSDSGYLARSRQADRLSVARGESTRKGWLSPLCRPLFDGVKRDDSIVLIDIERQVSLERRVEGASPMTERRALALV